MLNMIYCIWGTLQIKLYFEKGTLISGHTVTHFLNIWLDLNNANLNNVAKRLAQQSNTMAEIIYAQPGPWDPIPAFP